MVAGRHDIIADQGSTFKFFAEYQTEGATAVDLDGYTAEMHVRRYSGDEELLLAISGGTYGGGVTGGGSTGHFYITAGVAGTGGITTNGGSTNGFKGYTGGIFISVNSKTMKNVPSGKHFYDLELIKGSEVTRILDGRFEVNDEVTR